MVPLRPWTEQTEPNLELRAVLNQQSPPTPKALLPTEEPKETHIFAV